MNAWWAFLQWRNIGRFVSSASSNCFSKYLHQMSKSQIQQVAELFCKHDNNLASKNICKPEKLHPFCNFMSKMGFSFPFDNILYVEDLTYLSWVSFGQNSNLSKSGENMKNTLNERSRSLWSLWSGPVCPWAQLCWGIWYLSVCSQSFFLQYLWTGFSLEKWNVSMFL